MRIIGHLCLVYSLECATWHAPGNWISDVRPLILSLMISGHSQKGQDLIMSMVKYAASEETGLLLHQHNQSVD